MGDSIFSLCASLSIEDRLIKPIVKIAQWLAKTSDGATVAIGSSGKVSMTRFIDSFLSFIVDIVR